MPPFSLVVQAGGKSSRMGADKAFIPFLGKPLIEYLLEQLNGFGDETLIVTNRPDDYRYLGLPMTPDLIPNAGPLGGLYTALGAARHPHVFITAVDMPFVNRPLLDFLIGLVSQADAVVPQLQGEAEPLRAAYSQACREPIRLAIERGKMRMIAFHPDVRVRYVDEAEIDRFDPKHLSFFNVNTPDDLETARRLSRGQ